MEMQNELTGWAMIYLILHLLLFSDVTSGANWAQVAGTRQQNVVRPADLDFYKRQGHAITMYETTTSDGEIAQRMFLVGGEAFESNLQEDSANNGLLHYKNDVWMATSIGFNTYEHLTDTTEYGDPLPIIHGQMDWTLMTAGKIPPVDMTYEEWISCSLEVWEAGSLSEECSAEGSYYGENMWSPRRNHEAIVFGDNLYVLGGRAREHEDLAKENAVGGIVYPRVKNDPFYSNWRERTILRNDVWMSTDDGDTWELVTPGCHVNQEDLIYEGNSREGKFGPPDQACNDDSDCFGAAECRDLGDGGVGKTCVCTMWSPRELHQVVVFDDGDGEALYVIGGLAAIRKNGCGPFACGPIDATGYRIYMSDVWKSYDGEVWEAVTLSTSYGGRAGHQVLILNEQMILLGGAYGETGALLEDNTYFADMWYSDDGIEWYELEPTPNWPGRAGHLAILQTPEASNNEDQRIFVIGGHNNDGYFSDVWSWTGYTTDLEWKEDYNITDDSGAKYFVNPDSNLKYLLKVTPPTDAIDTSYDHVPMITDAQFEDLHSLGIYTIRDLAEADAYSILRLRGYDYPEVTDLLTAFQSGYYTICDIRELAIAVVEKCTVDESLFGYDGESSMPWNLDITYRDGVPVDQNALWHGKDFRITEAPVTTEQLVADWDGCTIIDGYGDIDFAGVGYVPQMDSIRDPWRELNELHCQWNPFPRTYADGAFFYEKVLLLGGTHDIDLFNEDVWIRDDMAPETYITKQPSSGSSQYTFQFITDEEGCIYEYRVYFLDENYEVRPWTLSYGSADISFLDDAKGGPGEGEYIFYVRAIDPAGNRDSLYEEGRNRVIWTYVPPLPWALIISMILLFLLLCILLYIWYRRRRRRKMLERYAIKRIRRKFKGLGADKEKATNWKSLYADQKDPKKKKKKKKKKKGEKPDDRKKKKKKKKDKKLKDYEKGEGGKKKKKYKEYEKGGKKKKYKEYEKGGKEGKKKKYKDYEKGGKEGKKKKYKDYEEKKDRKEKKKKYKDYEAKEGEPRKKKYKDYEAKEDRQERKKEKRLKDYEKKAKKFKDYEKPKQEKRYKANELEYMLDGEDKEEKDPGGDKPRRRRGKK